MFHVLATVLERPLHVADPLAPLDAIVVLGAPLARGGTLTSALRERAAAAAELYRAGGAPLIVASGGVTHGAPRAEADAIAEALLAAGVPQHAVLVEAASLTTADNARLTAQLLAPRGARRVWLVTQPFHGKRAARLFTSAGLEPRVWHIADSVQYRDRARAVRWLAREYAAWGKLLLLG
ncbi:MAG: YdcF family protein [Acidobacteriota bacterium]